MEFEQMLQEAEEANKEDGTPEGSSQEKDEATPSTSSAQPVVRKKAKTKIGNKSKRRKKIKTTSKFPEGDDGYEVFQFNIFSLNDFIDIEPLGTSRLLRSLSTRW